MVLARPPYRSDYERQCFPALPYSTCVNASAIDATDISALRTYLLSSGHIINAQRTSDRDIIGFFDESAIRAAARRYFTPRELITRILDSRILQGGLLKRLQEDDDLRDAIDALDCEQLRDRERFRLLYAADSFPAGVSDELDPVQISAAFTSLQGALRAEVDALRARSDQPAIRNFVLTRVRQKRADAGTIYGDNVMREFVTTLDPSRLTHEELNAILACVSGRTTTPTSCEREFRNLQAALRGESHKAHELIQRRYEPQPSDDCILRIALEMLNVRFVGGDGDVRCQLVRALADLYDGCDELLSPGPVGDMTPLCRQVNLFAVHGKRVMELGVEKQKRSFARLRADVTAVDLPTEPGWLGETRLRRMVELWQTEMADLHVMREISRRGSWEDAGGESRTAGSNNRGRMKQEYYTDTESGRESNQMLELEVEGEYRSPKSRSASPTSFSVNVVSLEIEWDEQDEQQSEVEEQHVCEEVHQPDWQQIHYKDEEVEGEDEDEDEDEAKADDEDEAEADDENEDGAEAEDEVEEEGEEEEEEDRVEVEEDNEDDVEDEDRHGDKATPGVHSSDLQSLNKEQVQREYRAPQVNNPPNPVKLDNARVISASPRIHPRHAQPEMIDVDETARTSESDGEDDSENQSEGRSEADSCESDIESQHDADRTLPKEPDRPVSVAGKAGSRKRRHNDSSSRNPQPSSDTPNVDTAYSRRDLAIETSIVKGNTAYWREREREVEYGAIADQPPWPRPKKHHKRPAGERGGARRTEEKGRDHIRRTHRRR